MTGILAGLAIAWCLWPLRPTKALVTRHPSLLVPASVLTASLIYHLDESAGRGALALALVGSAGVSLLEQGRHRAARSGFHFGQGRQLGRGLLAVFGLILWLAARDALRGQAQWEPVLALLAGCLLVVGITQALSTGVYTRALAAWFSGMYLSVALMVGGALGREWIDCRYAFDKCTAVGRIYLGIFSSENISAFLAAFTAALVLSSGATRRRVPLLVTLLGVVLLTGSRTSLIGLGLLPLGWFAVAVTAVRSRHGLWRPNRLLAVVGPVAAALAGLALVRLAQPGALSLRGTLWREALRHVEIGSIVGAGRSRYVELLDQGAFRGHYPHSEYMLLLFFGGLIAVGLFVVALSYLWLSQRGSSPTQLGFAVAPIVLVLTFGLTEVAWNPAGVDPTMWAVLALFALPQVVPRPRSRDDATALRAPS